jgi:hypothetical protein
MTASSSTLRGRVTFGRQRLDTTSAGQAAWATRGRIHGLVALLIAVRLVLGVVYSLVIPPWEGIDEDAHFAYAQYLAAHHHLLRAGDPEAARIRESHQPPLYYLLVALVLAPLRAGQPYAEVTRNPYLVSGAGYNYAIQTNQVDPSARSIIHALYAARWLTVLLSTGSALAIFAAARRIWPAQTLPAVAATALYAFWPQQLYLGSVVNNDALVTAWAAVFCYSAVRVALDGADLGSVLLMFGCLAAATLTKLNGLALGLPAAAALAWGLLCAPHNTRRRWPALGAIVLMLLGTGVGLSSLGYARGQVLQLQTIVNLFQNANQDGRLGLGFVLPGLAHGLRSFLAEFGWGNLHLPGWAYTLWGVALGLAILGLCNSLFEREVRLPARIFTVAWAQVLGAIGLALALGISLGSSYIILGRYMLPALPGVALLWAGGWQALWSRRWRPAALRSLSVAIILTGWCAPWLTLAPAYAQPVPLPHGATIAHPLEVTFDGALELAGYQALSRGRLGEVSVALCWQSLRAIRQDYTIQIEALAAGQVAGVLRTYPGHGTYPTTQWRTMQLFCEDYTVMGHGAASPVAPDALRISILDASGLQPVQVYDSSGALMAQPIDILVP